MQYAWHQTTMDMLLPAALEAAPIASDISYLPCNRRARHRLLKTRRADTLPVEFGSVYDALNQYGLVATDRMRRATKSPSSGNAHDSYYP